eukprot:8974564-Pyramimonas_sp.AAC.1
MHEHTDASVGFLRCQLVIQFNLFVLSCVPAEAGWSRWRGARGRGNVSKCAPRRWRGPPRAATVRPYPTARREDRLRIYFRSLTNVMVPWTYPSPVRGTGVHCGTAKGPSGFYSAGPMTVKARVSGASRERVRLRGGFEAQEGGAHLVVVEHDCEGATLQHRRLRPTQGSLSLVRKRAYSQSVSSHW